MEPSDVSPGSATSTTLLALCLAFPGARAVDAEAATPSMGFPNGASAPTPLSPSRTAFADAGKAQVATAGEVVRFHGRGASPDADVAQYSWDFDGDGVPDFTSTRSGEATHVFAGPGHYECALEVTDERGRTARSVCRVKVVPPNAALAPIPEMTHAVLANKVNPADGETHRYAIIFNGGAEARYWEDVTLCYAMLTEKYGFTPVDIYLLSHDGTMNGANPNGMIDYPATLPALQTVVSNLTAIADLDDEVFFCITDHGRGYSGPLNQGGRVFGYLDGRASVDPGDEPDYPEANFKLRGLMTGGNYMGGLG